MIAGFGGLFHQGLEYASIAPVMDALRVPRVKRPALFRDLQIMERAAAAVYNAPKDSDGG